MNHRVHVLLPYVVDNTFRLVFIIIIIIIIARELKKMEHADDGDSNCS